MDAKSTTLLWILTGHVSPVCFPLSFFIPNILFIYGYDKVLILARREGALAVSFCTSPTVCHIKFRPMTISHRIHFHKCTILWYARARGSRK
jgi:hypothetical protein